MRWLIVIGMLISSSGFCGDLNHPLRVTGDFVVRSITKNASGANDVLFHSVTKTGRLDLLRVRNTSVHFGIAEGDTYRISAEVVTERDIVGDVSQVMILFPKQGSFEPIWLLSQNYNNKRLRGAKYLEMHAPSSDYQVF